MSGENRLPPFPPFPEFVDSTMASCFASCPQKFLYEFIHKRVSAPSIHLHAGGAFAAALETFRISHFIDGKSYNEALFEAFERFSREWKDEEIEPEGTTKTFPRMWGAFKYYITEAFPLESEQFVPITEGDENGVEFSFALPTDIPHPETGDPILYVGRCDMLAKVRGGETIYVLDDKTTAYSTNDPRKWNLRGQLIGYVFAARQFGYKAQGAVIREIAIQKTQYKHSQHIILYPDYLLTHWWDEIRARILRMIQMYELAREIAEKSGYDEHWKAFPRSYGDACSSYGGCGYMQLCQMESPLDWLENYEVREWSPLR